MSFVDVLLGPMSPGEFVEEYWDKKPCLLRGDGERIGELLPGGLTVRRLVEILQRARELRGFEFVGQIAPSAFEVNGHEMREPPKLALTPHTAQKALTEGVDGLVTIWDLHLIDEGLLHFYSGIKQGLGLVGNCGTSVFCHPRSGRGIHLHFDHNLNFQLLLSGSKRWRVSPRPHEPWPRSSAYSRRDGTVEIAPDGWTREVIDPADLDLVEIEMQAGDVLYLPPGTWHTTNSTEGGSIGVTFYCYTATFHDLVAAAIKERFEREPEWRAGLPPSIAGSGGDGGAGDRMRAFSASRLDELRAFLSSLGPDAGELRRARQKLFAKRPAYLAPHLRAAPHPALELTAGELLRRPLDAPLATIEGVGEGGEPVIYVYYGDEEICFDDPRFFAFARRVVTTEPFRVAEATSWNEAGQEPYALEEVQPLLKALVDNGLLVRP